MSVAAYQWAWRQGLAPTVKLVLVALAEFSDERGRCWPSVNTLADRTGLNRRSVFRALQQLEGDFLQKQSRPGQVTAYQLCLWQPPKSATKTPPKTDTKPIQHALTIKEPEVAYRQDRGDTESPALALPVVAESHGGRDSVSREECHTVTGEVTQCHPNRNRTVKQPPKNRNSRCSKPNKTEVILPACVSPENWADFLDYRKSLKAPMSGVAQKRALNALVKLHDEGHDANAVIDQSIVNGWKGLFPLRATHTGRGGSKTVDNLKKIFGATDEERNVCQSDRLPGRRIRH